MVKKKIERNNVEITVEANWVQRPKQETRLSHPRE